MLKYKQRYNAFVVAVTIVSLLAVYIAVPVTNAASLQNAKDLISDSDLSASGVSHIFTFTSNLALPVNGYFEITFPAGFTGLLVGGLNCSGLTASVPSGQVARCTSGAGLSGSSTRIEVTGMGNPGSAASYTIPVVSYTAAGVELESADVMVAILSSVTVSASVTSTLTFTVTGLATTTDVNGRATTGSSTATTLPFGTLTTATSSVLGQRLAVATNAQDGFTVTVQQDHNLLSDNGADIDSFQDGTPPGSPIAWVAPANTLDTETTYGHFGLTTEDATLPADTYGTNLWSGFSGASSTPITVMYHSGPADGTTADKGLTDVAYQVHITALQEAGDYTNQLTYICTPQY